MGRSTANRWVLVGALLVGVILAGSLLVGIQTSQAKRWVFASGFTVDEVEVSKQGDFFVTASHPPDGRGPTRPTVLHYFTSETVYWNRTVPGPVSVLGLAASGALVAAGREDGGVQLYTGRGEDLGSYATHGPVLAIDVSSDGGLLAVGTELSAQATARGGLLLYRLGMAMPLIHVPKTGMADVALSEDGAVLVAAVDAGRTTQLLVYDRELSETRPQLVETFPGAFQALDLSSDGRHGLLVTDTAAFLIARQHSRPVGMIPLLPDTDPRFSGGVLAPDGQSHLLRDHEGTEVALYKWGEEDARWRHHTDAPVLHMHLDEDGKRAVIVDETGLLTVLSVTTGSPIKELQLEGDPKTMALSRDGQYVLASDAAGRLYRARSGYAGLLGVLPDPIVSALYAQPPMLLWMSVLLALTFLTYPTAAPLVRALARRHAPERPREPDAGPMPADAAGLAPLFVTRALDGPVLVDRLVVRKQHHTLLKGVSFQAQVGTLTAVVGGSGEGKSTLLHALLGQGVAGGNVRLGRIDPRRDAAALRAHVGFVAQDLQLYEALTPRENLAAFGGQFASDTQALHLEASRLLRLVGLDPETKRPVSALSGGERRRVSIAATLLHAPGLLILDEPTTGLDPLTRRQLWDLLRDLRERLHVTIVVSTHYLEEAEAADNVVILEDGMALATGSPDTVIDAAPGGPDLWIVDLDDADARRGGHLHDAVRRALSMGGDDPVAHDLHVTETTATLRLARGHDAAGEALRLLRLAGLDVATSRWQRMRFEDAFIAHIGDARRALGNTVPSPLAPSSITTTAGPRHDPAAALGA